MDVVIADAAKADLRQNCAFIRQDNPVRALTFNDDLLAEQKRNELSERQIKTHLAVEPIQPKSLEPSLTTDGSNLLLGWRTALTILVCNR
ncbi:hypothetical protein SIID45300_00770 [Candidatus Magnetaquicoccaceae bacterium FCR-1]|uniref:Uncharacterized protein n=1 Tax=Candidatus Magnetaquiglobus chichijimensis TaxID=3141448 RepID=A0ABQ0C6F9_9PROT